MESWLAWFTVFIVSCWVLKVQSERRSVHGHRVRWQKQGAGTATTLVALAVTLLSLYRLSIPIAIWLRGHIWQVGLGIAVSVVAVLVFVLMRRLRLPDVPESGEVPL